MDHRRRGEAEADHEVPGTASEGETRPDVGEAAPLHGAEDAGEEGRDGDGGGGGAEEEEEEEEGFEFCVATDGFSDGLDAVTADEIFSNGVIRPTYPFFGRALPPDGVRELGLRPSPSTRAGEEPPAPLPVRLRDLILSEDGDTPSAASPPGTDGLEGLPPGSYCAWEPRPGSSPSSSSPAMPRKSQSAGAASKRWRLCSFAVGRSHSDGKQRLVFLHGAGSPTKKEAAARPESEKKGKGKGRVTEMDIVTAHRLYYSKGGAGTDRRRTFLPYRRDLLSGLSSNVNGQGSFSPY